MCQILHKERVLLKSILFIILLQKALALSPFKSPVIITLEKENYDYPYNGRERCVYMFWFDVADFLKLAHSTLL